MKAATLGLGVAILAGCSSTVAVKVQEPFPNVVFEPRPYHAALVFPPEFRTYVAKPNENTTIDIGSAQVELLTKAFEGLFVLVSPVTARSEVAEGAEIVITPKVVEVQVSTPSENYLNVYEVWIKYSLDIESADGAPIDSWFMPAYGKTPDSMMLSRSEAIQEAAVVALRDAGAKLLLDFFRIPSVYSWMERYEDTQGNARDET
jgi:hypothetical protein